MPCITVDKSSLSISIQRGIAFAHSKQVLSSTPKQVQSCNVVLDCLYYCKDAVAANYIKQDLSAI